MLLEGLGKGTASKINRVQELISILASHGDTSYLDIAPNA